MKVLLVDLSGIYWAMWHSTADQEVSAAFERTTGMIWKMAGGYDRVAICCDGPPYRRKEILPQYKSQRDAPPPQALEQLERVKARLAKDGHLIWQVRGYEADDLLATATRLIVDQRLAESVTIASGDKDLLCMVNDEVGVSVLSPISQKLMKRADVLEKFAVDPRDMPDLLALMGDSSDNVPGIPGVGPKNAAKLLAEFGSLEGVLTHADDMKEGAIKNAILTHGPAARLARRVIDLDTSAPIDVSELFAERKLEAVTDVPIGDPDEADPELDAVLPPAKSPSTGIVKTDPNEVGIQASASFERGLEPGSLGGAYKLAQGMYNSRLYSRFPTPEAIWAVIVRGRELGLGALTALDCMHIIEGKPAIHAHLIIARAKAHPDCEYFRMVESTAERAVYETKNRNNPEPTRHTYTIDDARRAGLAPDRPRERNPSPGEKDRRGQWEKRPAEMIRKTCAAQLARIEYPDAALGVYSLEELEES